MWVTKPHFSGDFEYVSRLNLFSAQFTFYESERRRSKTELWEGLETKLWLTAVGKNDSIIKLRHD